MRRWEKRSEQRTYGESTPGAKLALVTDSSRETVTSHNFHCTELLFDKGMDGNRLPDRFLSLFVDLERCPIVLGVGNHDGDTP